LIEPHATYRLQLGPDLDFAAATKLFDYLSALGISHVYLSPCLQARRGSTHGYDVVDPTRVSADLGGEAGFDALCAAAKQAGLGVLVDVVPNHMSIDGSENGWWIDVLENGQASYFADVFDVDWTTGDDRILLPILGVRYGRALASGTIHLARERGLVWIQLEGHRLPLAPRTMDRVLKRVAERLGHDQLDSLSDAFAALPPASSREPAARRRRHRDKNVLREHLGALLERDPEAAAAVDQAMTEISRDPAELDAILEVQNFRLAHWSVSRSDVGYRRFFDVSSLAGLRTEDEPVFAATHKVILGWLTSGKIDGVRIDHPDGLRDPEGYFTRLRQAAPDSWIVVEKILAAGEELPSSWPVDGTVGYEHTDLLGAMLVDPRGEAALVAIWEQFTGETRDPTGARRGRKDVLDDVLHGEVLRLVEIAARASASCPAYRDLTRRELSEALREILASFPVYRTYVRPGQRAGTIDARRIDAALEATAAALPALDGDVLAFLGAALRGEIPHPDAIELALRFQQTSGAVMAKGVEDTHLYRETHLVARNEVGTSGRFARPVDDLFETQFPPRGLIATATHDTKRGEDVRARLAVLSEIPEEWAAAVTRWRARRPGPGTDPVMTYLFWQTLVGAWPLSEERAQVYLQKAAREAKRFTSWHLPNAPHEQATREHISAVFADAELLADVRAFVERIERAGRVNSLVQTLLKVTLPGVCDIYQGTELWDGTLVDPDNRRAVDFATRRDVLASLRGATPEAILERMVEGAPKLYVLARGLAARKTGSWRGPPRRVQISAPHLAFQREGVVVVAPRFSMTPPAGQVTLPAGRWRNVFDDREHEGEVALPTLWQRFPVALLVPA
jgi:(1->4)-alpha-D-glucan 1-alpha-D-glucosylmutase